MPRFAHAAQGRVLRLVTIILRGAMDGLSAVAPLGDPDYVALREGIALSSDGDKPALPLDGFFALHPAMANFARLYKANQALVVHDGDRLSRPFAFRRAGRAEKPGRAGRAASTAAG